MKNKMYKILWLSDIHYQHVDNETDLGKMFTKLIDFVNDYKPDLCIISGDIAMEGGIKEHYTTFIDKISQIDCHFLSIPGNHDLMWKNASYIFFTTAELRNNIFGIKKYSDLESLINSFNRDKKEFNDHFFENYQDKFWAHYLIKLERAADRFKCVTIGNKQNLNYIVFDKLFNTIFILINSSWMSLVNPLAKVENSLTYEIPYEENGNQFYFSIEVRKNLEKFINENKVDNALKVLVAHHPPSWVHWTERNIVDVSESSPLEKLLDNVDLILVGHEHTQPAMGDFIFGKSLMLRGLRLMHHNIKNGETDIHNNGFKTLEVTPNKVIHEKSYTFSGDEWKEHTKQYKYEIPALQQVFGKKVSEKRYPIEEYFSSKVKEITNISGYEEISNGIIFRQVNNILEIIILNRKNFTPIGKEKLVEKMKMMNSQITEFHIELQEHFDASIWDTPAEVIEDIYTESNRFLTYIEHDLGIITTKGQVSKEKQNPVMLKILSKSFFKNTLNF